MKSSSSAYSSTDRPFLFWKFLILNKPSNCGVGEKPVKHFLKWPVHDWKILSPFYLLLTKQEKPDISLNLWYRILLVRVFVYGVKQEAEASILVLTDRYTRSCQRPGPALSAKLQPTAIQSTRGNYSWWILTFEGLTLSSVAKASVECSRVREFTSECCITTIYCFNSHCLMCLMKAGK